MAWWIWLLIILGSIVAAGFIAFIGVMALVGWNFTKSIIRL